MEDFNELKDTMAQMCRAINDLTGALEKVQQEQPKKGRLYRGKVRDNNGTRQISTTAAITVYGHRFDVRNPRALVANAAVLHPEHFSIDGKIKYVDEEWIADVMRRNSGSMLVID